MYIRASLTINIIECKLSQNRPVAYPMCRSVCLCVQKIHCGKTDDWVQMSFGW